MRPRGGIIGASVTPTQSAASGIWTPREAEAYKRSGVWPALPGAPTGVTGSNSSGSVALTWTAPASNGGYEVTDYIVQYSSDSGSNWSTFSHSASSSASATVTGLTSGTSYIFRVAAVTSLGTGPYSSASSSVTPASFAAMAVLLTSGTSYTVPSGATTMKAWAVGAGNIYQNAGGVAYKTWSVSGGATVGYSTGPAPTTTGSVHTDTTVTYGGVTIRGLGASAFSAGGSYSGGDGGANGGAGQNNRGGAVGGNGTTASCGRVQMTDVSGLKAAVALAGGKTTEDCGATPAFGSGGRSKYDPRTITANGGYGAGCGTDPNSPVAGAGAVVLYFS